MSLTLLTNPATTGKSFFAGFDKIEFTFKREDIAITSVDSGSGGARINHAGDLTSYLSVGDTVYFYSEGSNYIYDKSAEILSIIAGQITVDAEYIEDGGAGYMNYFKNYYVEMQIVDSDLTGANLLPFSLQSDGDAAGNINIDVSIINDLNRRRGLIEEGAVEESSQQFKVKYKQVYTGSSESFTVVSSILIALYCTEAPKEDDILNGFEYPEIYKGYPALLAVCRNAVGSGTVGMNYTTQDNNKVSLSTGSLTDLDDDFNGFTLWKWDSSKEIDSNAKYINFELATTVVGDFAAGDFATPDFELT